MIGNHIKYDVRWANDFFTLLQIFIEADLDEDNQLSFAEFEHVISKAPDFVEYDLKLL